MKKYGSRVVILLALLLILSSLFSLTAFASGSDPDAGVTQAESESDALIPQTEGADLSAPAFAAPQIPVTAEPVTRPESSREPVTPDPPISYPPPDTHEIPDEEDERSFWEKCKDFFSDVGDFIDDVKEFFTGFGQNIADAIWGGFPQVVADWAGIAGGRYGLLNILKDGGARYSGNALNDLINALYEVFYVPGIIVMVICFCFGVFKGCYSMELGDRNSIVKPIIGMIIALFTFSVAKKVMTALFQISMQLTEKIVETARGSGIGSLLDAAMSSGNSHIGYAIIGAILELILMVNIAKIALLQSTSPLYLGFAAAENTRRVLINFAKEYAKCCLIPPITAAYTVIVMVICDSTWKLFGSIVLGISIWSIGRKFQEKILS